jgi:hypothetical protein
MAEDRMKKQCHNILLKGVVDNFTLNFIQGLVCPKMFITAESVILTFGNQVNFSVKRLKSHSAC